MAVLTTEQIVYLLRKTNLTRSEIGKLTPVQVAAILNEVYLQESQDHWRQQHNLATLLAAIYNTIPKSRGAKVLTASDFIGEMPAKGGASKDKMTELAEKHGIKLPDEENDGRD